MSLRASVERSSRPAVDRLAGLPVWLPPTLVLAVIVGGAWLGGAAGVAMVTLGALGVAWMLYLAWPHLPPVARLGQAALLLIVAAVAAVLLTS